MSRYLSLTPGRAFIILCSAGIAIGITAIAGMLLAATAFANGVTITIPLIATFTGVRESDGSPTVTITGSWAGTALVTLMLALPLWVFALRYRTDSRET